MKRILAVALIALFAVVGAFASDSYITVSGSPYAKQFVDTSWDTDYSSVYGAGATLGYRFVSNGFVFGVDASYKGYDYDEYDDPLHNLQLMGLYGYRVALGNGFMLTADVAAGAELDIADDSELVPVLGASLEASCPITETVKVFGGVEGNISWHDSKDSNYDSKTWSVISKIGLEFHF